MWLYLYDVDAVVAVALALHDFADETGLGDSPVQDGDLLVETFQGLDGQFGTVDALLGAAAQVVVDVEVGTASVDLVNCIVVKKQVHFCQYLRISCSTV